MIRNIVSVDLAQQSDYTATSIIQIREHWMEGPNIPADWNPEMGDKFLTFSYYLRYLDRGKLKYPEVVRQVKKIVDSLEQDQGTALLVDATGVGLPVVDMMREELLNPIPIWITSGNSVTDKDGGYGVPKRFLVTALQGLFETGKLKISSGVQYLEELIHELSHFKVKITKSGNDAYEAWRESDHDDLVMSVAMGAWFARRESGNNILVKQGGGLLDEYDPLGRV